MRIGRRSALNHNRERKEQGKERGEKEPTSKIKEPIEPYSRHNIEKQHKKQHRQRR
jgi:hypothetical protein